MLTFSGKSRHPRRQTELRHPGRGLAPLSQPAQSADAVEPLPDEDELIVRKGWHDSSSDLKRGLDVVENVPIETLPPALRAGLKPRR